MAGGKGASEGSRICGWARARWALQESGFYLNATRRKSLKDFEQNDEYQPPLRDNQNIMAAVGPLNVGILFCITQTTPLTLPPTAKKCHDPSHLMEKAAICWERTSWNPLFPDGNDEALSAVSSIASRIKHFVIQKDEMSKYNCSPLGPPLCLLKSPCLRCSASSPGLYWMGYHWPTKKWQEASLRRGEREASRNLREIEEVFLEISCHEDWDLGKVVSQHF